MSIEKLIQHSLETGDGVRFSVKTGDSVRPFLRLTIEIDLSLSEAREFGDSLGQMARLPEIMAAAEEEMR